MPRDIRSSQDWVDTGEDKDSAPSWQDSVPQEGLEEEARRRSYQVPAAIPTSLSGVAVPGSTGIQGGIAKQYSPGDVLWARKQKMQPCMMCAHFQHGVFSPEEKALLFQRLVKDHGWSQDMLTLELGALGKYHYCRIYRLLTHMHASCPKYFKLRSDV